MRISVFNGSYQNLKPNDLIEDWEDLRDLLMCPTEGQKNGQYFVRGECVAPRCDESMRSIDVIVTDGDSTMTNGASCVPPQPVHAAMLAEQVGLGVEARQILGQIDPIMEGSPERTVFEQTRRRMS